ncbi:MAG: conjugal transfer protein TraH [Thermocrinis sp.]|jgi:hypothetical protein|uniref:conjugal transfer protein TraH n=1 Tax=Thermocrinis sp. TaxID=2024383 RepID=UPI003BFCB756
MRGVGLFLSALALVCFIVQQGFGRPFLDGAIIEYDKPIEVRGKEMTSFGGGGIRIRWVDQSYALVNVVPPSLKMGCGGIDINLGALGLLNFDQFGKLFEALMGPAGVMFAAQLALSALCPQCAQTLQQLMNLANQLNQMQISKCGAVQMAGTLGQLSGRWVHDEILGGRTDSWVKSFDKSVESVAKQLEILNRQVSRYCPNGKCGAALMLKGSCIMEEAVKETTVANFLGLDNRSLAAVMRGYLGDVCFPGKRNLSDAFSGVPQEPVPYIAKWGGDPHAFITWIAGINASESGGNITGLSCVGSSSSPEKFPFFNVDENGNISFQEYPVYINTTICMASKQLVDRIFNAVQSRRPLSAEDKALLSAMPVGVFKLINYGSVYTGFLDGIKEDLAYYIAEEAAIGLLQKLNQKVAEWAVAYQSGLTQNDNSQPTPASYAAQLLLKNISEAQKELANYRRYTMEQLRQKIQSYQVANQIYNDMLAQMAKSPIYGNMVFSRLIGLGPVGNR